VEFAILGPLEIVDGEREVTPPRGRDRELLLHLLVHRREVVSLDRLVEDLWDGRPPATAAKVVQNSVSRLRRDAVGDRLVTRPPGYLLRVEEGELDVDRALALSSRARSEESERAFATLGEALALWRGEPLSDVADASFAQSELRRLDEIRIGLVEQRMDAGLAAGEAATLVAELEREVANHPFRERLRGQLMLALYRAGRQSEALDCYRTGRQLLAGELGLEPGPELRELEGRMLRHDPDLLPRRAARRSSRRYVGVAVLGVASVAAVVATVMLVRNHPGPVLVAANRVVRFDPATGRPTASFAVGATPRSVAVDRDAVWVVDYGDRTVTRVARSTGASATTGTGSPATALATGAGACWAVSSFDGSLDQLEPRGGDLVAGVSVGLDPTAVATGSNVYVTSQSAGTLLRVDSRSLDVGVLRRHLPGPSGVVAQGNVIWVALSFSRQIIEVDSRTGRTLRTLTVSLSPDALALGGGALWATNPAENDVTRVDLRTGLFKVLPVGNDPVALAAGPQYVWVVNDLDHSIAELDADSGDVLRTIFLTRGNPQTQPGKPPPRAITPGGVAIDEHGAAWVTIQRF
jgi:DNA-binding SARP family transcriptional activator